MTERPIIFSGEMVRAILAGRKTQTRRVVKPEWQSLPLQIPEYQADASTKCPYGVVGDLLWVRETWRAFLKKCEANRGGLRAFDPKPSLETSYIEYRIDGDRSRDFAPWRSPMLMPRWASRITLEVVRVRVERLQAITPEDCNAEGCPDELGGEYAVDGMNSRVAWFMYRWDAMHAKRSPWSSNPFVWVVEFGRVK